MRKGWLPAAMELLAITSVVVVLAMLASRPAWSATPEGEKLYQSAGCSACHAIDKKIVGPSYEAVAKKYAGQPNAVPMLVEAVKKGHVGTWGPVPMPPHPNLPDSEIKKIVEWILTLK